MVGNISPAYLEAFTLETDCVIAGPEFGLLAGHFLTIVRALYGLHTSGAIWHGCFANVMHLLGFSPSKTDPDVSMHDCITHFAYVLVYVDDIMFSGREPQLFFESLINEHGFKLKGVGTPTYHLGGDVYRDSDDTLVCGAHSYVSIMFRNYETMFGSKPNKFLGWVNFWPLVQPLLFWKGETIQDKPFSVIIQGTKTDPIIGSRGVTDQIQS
jgi:Reverse transcriptase (RNA-dependent DNA polymerase)